MRLPFWSSWKCHSLNEHGHWRNQLIRATPQGNTYRVVERLASLDVWRKGNRKRDRNKVRGNLVLVHRESGVCMYYYVVDIRSNHPL